MSEYSCQIRNLRTTSLAGFRREKDALSAGGRYLRPDSGGRLNVDGLTGLCVVCENCGAVLEEAPDADELVCPDCGESVFRVFQTFRLITIKDGFCIRWLVEGLLLSIEVPDSARAGMTGVRYTVDGSDPTLDSPAYTKPIEYQEDFAPIRAAIFYSDARSQIIEWDYGRAEANRQRIQEEADAGAAKHIPKEETSLPPAVPPPEMPTPVVPKKAKGTGCGCFLALAIEIVSLLIISAVIGNVNIVSISLSILATSVILSIIGHK